MNLCVFLSWPLDFLTEVPALSLPWSAVLKGNTFIQISMPDTGRQGWIKAEAHAYEGCTDLGAAGGDLRLDEEGIHGKKA